MKALATLLLVCALDALFGIQRAEAAVTCVENKTTGRFDEKAKGRAGTTGECEAQAAMNRASSLADMEEVSAADGTKIIDGFVVTNAAKPFGAIGNTKKEEAAGGQGDKDVVDTAKPVSAAAKAAAKAAALAAQAEAAAAASKATQAAQVAQMTQAAPMIAQAATAAPQAAQARSARPAAKVEPEKRYWDVRVDDKTIYGTLARWAAQAQPKRQVAWELPREHEVSAGDSGEPFFGTFEDAVDRVLDSFEYSEYPPKGCFYSNGVLRVVRRIGDGLECKR
jgi:hypothetical protein